MSEKKHLEGKILSFSNLDKKVEIVRHGKRERYDEDIKAFSKSAVTTAQVSVSDVTLDSLATSLRDRIKKLGLLESLAIKTVRDRNKKVLEVWIVKTPEK